MNSRDVTEIRERTQQLRVLDRVLRHNLHNAMTIILGYGELIAEEATGSLANYANRIVSEGTDLVETVTYFLDAVMEDFIQSLEKYRDSDSREDQLTFEYMKRAHKFAKRHRAIGVSALGWHSLLQSKGIPLESEEADQLNVEVFKTIKERTRDASEEMADEYGEPEVLEGYGRRNTTTMAIAPTTSSSFILGQESQSIEPLMSNCYVKDLAKIKTTIRNPYLKEVLEEHDKNDISIKILNGNKTAQKKKTIH
mgnify:CR=1 FL=1